MPNNDKTHFLVVLTLLVYIASLLGISISLFLTNPTVLGPGGVTFWFMAFMLMVISFITLLLYQLQKDRPKFKEQKKACYYSSLRSGLILGVSLTVLLALSSLRSLSWRDFLLFAVAVVIVEVLLRTRRARA